MAPEHSDILKNVGMFLYPLYIHLLRILSAKHGLPQGFFIPFYPVVPHCPWHFFHFFPLPQGQGSLRLGSFGPVAGAGFGDVISSDTPPLIPAALPRPSRTVRGTSGRGAAPTLKMVCTTDVRIAACNSRKSREPSCLYSTNGSRWP